MCGFEVLPWAWEQANGVAKLLLTVRILVILKHAIGIFTAKSALFHLRTFPHSNEKNYSN